MESSFGKIARHSRTVISCFYFLLTLSLLAADKPNCLALSLFISTPLSPSLVMRGNMVGVSVVDYAHIWSLLN